MTKTNYTTFPAEFTLNSQNKQEKLKNNFKTDNGQNDEEGCRSHRQRQQGKFWVFPHLLWGDGMPRTRNLQEKPILGLHGWKNE